MLNRNIRTPAFTIIIPQTIASSKVDNTKIHIPGKLCSSQYLLGIWGNLVFVAPILHLAEFIIKWWSFKNGSKFSPFLLQIAEFAEY